MWECGILTSLVLLRVRCVMWCVRCVLCVVCQLWRPFTAAAFLGAPSMSWLSNVWFLLQYGRPTHVQFTRHVCGGKVRWLILCAPVLCVGAGQQLEMSEGTAQQVVFLLFQVHTHKAHSQSTHT